MDPDTPAGHPSRSYSGHLQPQPNGQQYDISRPADQTPAPPSGGPAALGSVMNDATPSRLASAFPAQGQPGEAPGLNQVPLQQQQILLPPHGAPTAATPDVRGLDVMGLSAPEFGGDGDDWMGGPAMGNWDGGMPDILGGVTWESLLHVVNQDNLAGRGGFL